MTKNQLVKGIKKFMGKWGTLTTKDLEMESSFVFCVMSKDHTSLIERLYSDSVGVVTYVHETEVDEVKVIYENVDYDLLYDIYNELERYDVMMTKTMDKCRDENWN